MTAFFQKASSSRIGFNTILNYTGSGTVSTTNVHAGCYHVRVLSQVPGFLAIDVSASSSGSGTLIAANTAGGDYFSCIPGNIVTFSSTLGTSGTLSVTEML
jgi:hypothetical protein